MTSKLVAMAAAAVIAFPALAFAQNAAPAPAAGGDQYNEQNVTKDKPFGEIDVGAAMGANADIAGWAGALNAQQRAELTGRCAFISGHAGDFAADAVTLCGNYSTWDQANPVR